MDWENCTGMPKLLHPLLALIASSTESELAKYVDYLKTENRILRARLRTPEQAESDSETETVQSLARGHLVLRESLGGVLKWYERKAA